MKTWKGQYRFTDAPAALQSKTIRFEIRAEMDEDSFTGLLVEDEYGNLTERDIKVNGFFLDNFVSFVATYPFKRRYSEEGQPFLDTELADHEITFYGEFDNDPSTISGQWEIVEQTHIGTLGINLALTGGTFEMEELPG